MEKYNRVYVNGKKVRKGRAVWNEHHPEDPFLPGDGCVIHHKDGNKKNDAPENLQKLPAAKHKSHHGNLGAKALERWRNENPEKALEHRKDCARRMLATLKADPERYAEWQRKRVEATIKSNKERTLPRDEWKRRRAEYMREYRLRKKGLE